MAKTKSSLGETLIFMQQVYQFRTQTTATISRKSRSTDRRVRERKSQWESNAMLKLIHNDKFGGKSNQILSMRTQSLWQMIWAKFVDIVFALACVSCGWWLHQMVKVSTVRRIVTSFRMWIYGECCIKTDFLCQSVFTSNECVPREDVWYEST